MVSTGLTFLDVPLRHNHPCAQPTQEPIAPTRDIHHPMLILLPEHRVHPFYRSNLAVLTSRRAVAYSVRSRTNDRCPAGGQERGERGGREGDEGEHLGACGLREGWWRWEKGEEGQGLEVIRGEDGDSFGDGFEVLELGGNTVRLGRERVCASQCLSARGMSL